MPLLGKVPLSEELREHADAGTPLVLADPDAPASSRDPRGGARDRRRDPAGAPGDAGRAARRAGARRRSAAPSCRSSRSRAERAPSTAASSTAAGGTSGSRSTSAATSMTSTSLQGRRPGPCGRSSSRRSATSPASGSPTSSATSASTRSPGRGAGASVVGLDFSAPAVEAANELAAETGLDGRFVQADLYDAREALGASASTSSTPASGRSTGCPTCAAGRSSWPRCSPTAGSSTWPSSTRSPGVFADEDLSIDLRLLPRPRRDRLRGRRRHATPTLDVPTATTRPTSGPTRSPT